MGSDITVRPARAADQDLIVEYSLRLAAETEDLVLDRAVLDAGVGAALNDPAKGRYFIAERGGEAAGQLMLTYEWSDWRNATYLWIQSVYVHADHRKRGVFRALYEHAEAMSRSPGYCGLRLYVVEGNTDARATYRRLGMVTHGYEVLETPDQIRSDHP